jgi:hypothetical protein
MLPLNEDSDEPAPHPDSIAAATSMAATSSLSRRSLARVVVVELNRNPLQDYSNATVAAP